MKHCLLKFAASFAALATLFSACEEVKEPVYADVPFGAISITAGAETVDGTINGTNISFSFAEVEDFTSCSINLEVNEGWTCTWPADLTAVDLTVDENLVLQFTSPQNAIVKYYISFMSNKLPIADASKIKVKGDPSAVVEVNNAAKTLKIYYNQATMDASNIELVFEDGALIPGATVSKTVFDFSATLGIDFEIKTATGGAIYTLKLDKSSLMPNPATLGFSDVTADYTTVEGVTVLKATSLAGIPDRRYKFDVVENGYIDETPFSGSTGYYGDWWSYCNGECAHTVWEGLGDEGVEARQKVTIDGLEVVVVLIDESELAGKMYTDASNSVVTGTVGSFLTISGASSTQAEAGLWAKDTWYDDYLDATWAGLKDGYRRTAIGFDDEGKMSMVVSLFNGGKWYKWNYLYKEDCSYPDLADFSEWNVNSVAVSVPSHVRGGHKMLVQELRTSDDWGTESAFGDAWNGNRARMFAGRTYDGKVAYAAFQGKFALNEVLGWKEYNAIGTVQASYVLEKLGFSDVIQIGTAMYTEDGFLPTIILDGKTLIGDPQQAAKYCIGYDVR